MSEVDEFLQMERFFDFILNEYSWLIDSYMINYFVDGLWDKLPNSWRCALEDFEPEDCICLVDVTVPTRKVLPLSLICLRNLLRCLPSRQAVATPGQVAKACGIQNASHGDFAAITSRENWRTKLKPKKQYEIDRVVTTIDLLRKDSSGSSFNTIIDIGAGMGHLTRILSISLPGCKVISVEQNGELIRRSNLLNDRLQRIEDFTVPLNYCESVQDGLSGSVMECLKEEETALIIGLHPCGNLSVSIMRTFMSSPKVTTMLLFGCCYHKLTCEEETDVSQEDRERLGFPLSSRYRGKHLSYAARDLACHGNEIYAGQLLTKPHSSYRIQCYRAVLEYLLTRSSNEVLRERRPSLVVQSISSKNEIRFEQYVQKALAKNPDIIAVLENEITQDDEARRLIKSVDSEWRRFLVVHCLRLLFARAIEEIIILDRVQYLREHGHRVTVVPLFDPRISPRNIAIIARK